MFHRISTKWKTSSVIEGAPQEGGQHVAPMMCWFSFYLIMALIRNKRKQHVISCCY